MPPRAHKSEYWRVIIRIRKKTHQRVMDLLSFANQGDNLSAIVEGLLNQWLIEHESRPVKAKGKSKK